VRQGKLLAGESSVGLQPLSFFKFSLGFGDQGFGIVGQVSHSPLELVPRLVAPNI